jgi:hypothetical protein
MNTNFPPTPHHARLAVSRLMTPHAASDRKVYSAFRLQLDQRIHGAMRLALIRYFACTASTKAVNPAVEPFLVPNIHPLEQ